MYFCDIPLVPHSAFAEIESVARFVPEAMSFFILECHLGNTPTRVDFSTCTTAADKGPRILGPSLQSTMDASRPEARETWNAIRTFCLQWADPATPFFDRIPLVWLEFDVVGPVSELPVPSVFFCLKDMLRDRSDSPAKTGDPQADRQTSERILSGLLKASTLSALKDNLDICFGALPSGGRISQVGAMLSRSTDAIRLCVEISKDLALNYLTDVGWQGRTAGVEDLLSTFSPCADRLYLSLDVGSAISPRVGLEFIFNTLPDREPRGTEFLDRLLGRSLCTADQHEALLAWPGLSRVTSPADSAPTTLCRWLSHVKVVLLQSTGSRLGDQGLSVVWPQSRGVVGRRDTKST